MFTIMRIEPHPRAGSAINVFAKTENDIQISITTTRRSLTDRGFIKKLLTDELKRVEAKIPLEEGEVL